MNRPFRLSIVLYACLLFMTSKVLAQTPKQLCDVFVNQAKELVFVGSTTANSAFVGLPRGTWAVKDATNHFRNNTANAPSFVPTAATKTTDDKLWVAGKTFDNQLVVAQTDEKGDAQQFYFLGKNEDANITAMSTHEDQKMVVVAGKMNGAFWLARLNAPPQYNAEKKPFLWSKKPFLEGQATAVSVLKDGKIVAIGFDKYESNGQSFVICCDAFGNVLWQRYFEQTHLYDIFIENENRIKLIGSALKNSQNYVDMLVLDLAVDENGRILRRQLLGGQGKDEARQLVIDPKTGNRWLVGNSTSQYPNSRFPKMCIVALNGKDSVWAKNVQYLNNVTHNLPKRAIILDNKIGIIAESNQPLFIIEPLSISRENSVLTADWREPDVKMTTDSFAVFENTLHLALDINSSETIEKQDIRLTLNGKNITEGVKFDEVKLVKMSPQFFRWTYNLSLVEGKNAVEVTVKNAAGALKKTLVVIKKAEKPRLYVLSIGIPYNNLSFPPKDAHDIAVLFKKMEGTQKLFEHVDTIVLNTPALTTLTKLKEAMSILHNLKIRQQDVVVVFISGHGIPNETETDVAVQQSDMENVDYRSGWSLKDDILKHLGDIKGKKLLLLDACHSGVLNRGVMSNDLNDINDAIKKLMTTGDKLFCIASSRGNQKSHESEKWANSAFVKGIKEAFDNRPQETDEGNRRAVNNGRMLSALALAHFLEIRVPMIVKEKDQLLQQNPTIFNAESGDFPIFISEN